ncbi:hypothetical protein [Caldalkalibacillus mannanilyticus]|uniref:hypothetical protein n=1 Tax=Caldalkalibacillus mannanilyticus TaxID=1418 RepID=UPI0004695E3C|nr:hypothetical protein [Caldalkalibacillus mannanilyticus]
MSMCCGASMIGTIGTVKHFNTFIHQVPIVYCPICQSIEVYEKIKDEYDILAEYAQNDHAPEVFFNDYIEYDQLEELFSDCLDVDSKINASFVKKQIDHALDLLSVARQIKDSEWESELFQRLKVLSERLRKYQRKIS